MIEPRKFSNSELTTFKDCRRKWWLTYYRRLGRKRESVTGAAAIGTGVHHALEAHYRGGDALAALAQLHEEWRQLLPSPDHKGFESECELRIIMVRGYLEWVRISGVDDDLEIVSTEQYLEAPFEVPGYGTVLLIGKLDARVRDIRTGHMYVVDHKTVPGFGSHALLLESHEQMLHYFLLELLQGGGQVVEGVLYNMLKKVKQTRKAEPPFYLRESIRYNEAQLTSYRQRLAGTIRDILDVTARLDSGESFQSACYSRRSDTCSWKCPFDSVCPLFDDGSRAEALLADEYTSKDPHSHYIGRNHTG